MSTPIYDELEEKWNAVASDGRISDKYIRCFYVETGAEWFEDDFGNEVFLSVGGVIPAGTDLDYVSGLQTDCAIRDYPNYVADTLVCTVCSTKTRKWKLFGRNSQCDGCV